MGTFIVIEGPDGSGTTEHARLLAQRLSNKFAESDREVLLTAEPSSGTVGMEIRSILERTDVSLSSAALQLMFCADRAEHIATTLQPALDKNAIVICDRYISSTLCYGAAFDLDTSWLEAINSPFLQPNVELCLLPPFEVTQTRLGKRVRTDELEEYSVQEKVYQQYQLLAERKNIPVIDTSESIEKVAELVYGMVEHQI